MGLGWVAWRVSGAKLACVDICRLASCLPNGETGSAALPRSVALARRSSVAMLLAELARPRDPPRGAVDKGSPSAVEHASRGSEKRSSPRGCDGESVRPAFSRGENGENGDDGRPRLTPGGVQSWAASVRPAVDDGRTGEKDAAKSAGSPPRGVNAAARSQAGSGGGISSAGGASPERSCAVSPEHSRVADSEGDACCGVSVWSSGSESQEDRGAAEDAVAVRCTS